MYDFHLKDWVPLALVKQKEPYILIEVLHRSTTRAAHQEQLKNPERRQSLGL